MIAITPAAPMNDPAMTAAARLGVGNVMERKRDPSR
jgi:hypothetical protein